MPKGIDFPPVPPPSPEDQEKLDAMIAQHEQDEQESIDKSITKAMDSVTTMEDEFAELASSRTENAGLPMSRRERVRVGKAYAASDERHFKEAAEPEPVTDLHAQAPEKLKSVKDSLGVRKEIAAKKAELKEAEKAAGLALKRPERDAHLATVSGIESAIAELESKLPKPKSVTRVRKGDWERFAEVTEPHQRAKTAAEMAPPVLPGQDQELPFETIPDPVTPKESLAESRQKLYSLITNHYPQPSPDAAPAGEESPVPEGEPESVVEEPAEAVAPTQPEAVAATPAGEETPVPEAPAASAPESVAAAPASGVEATPASAPQPSSENPMQLMQNRVLNKIIMEGRPLRRKQEPKRRRERKSLSMGGTKHMHTDLTLKGPRSSVPPVMPVSTEAVPQAAAPQKTAKKSGGLFGFLSKNPKKAAAGAGAVGLVGLLAAIGLNSGEHGSTAKKAPEKKGNPVPAAKSAQEAGVKAPVAAAPNEAKPPPQVVKTPEAKPVPNKLKNQVEQAKAKNKFKMALEAAKREGAIESQDYKLVSEWQGKYGGFPPINADGHIQQVVEIIRKDPTNPHAFEGVTFEPKPTEAPQVASREPVASPEASVTPTETVADTSEGMASKQGIEIDTREPHAYSALDARGNRIIFMYGGAGDAAFLAAQQYATTLPEGTIVRFEAYDVDQATGVSKPMYGAFRSNGPGAEATPQFRDPETDESYDMPVDKSRFDRRLDFTFARS